MGPPWVHTFEPPPAGYDDDGSLLPPPPPEPAYTLEILPDTAPEGGCYWPLEDVDR